MQIHLIAVGNKMPGWVDEGYQTFARRLPHECNLKLHEIPAAKRGKGADINRLIRIEGDKMRTAIPKGAHCVALEVQGRSWSTEQLSERMQHWLGQGSDVALLVGGPEGLEPQLSASAHERWSLSPLTLPHPLVRIVLAEQLYRAWTILQGHPYHRSS